MTDLTDDERELINNLRKLLPRNCVTLAEGHVCGAVRRELPQLREATHRRRAGGCTVTRIEELEKRIRQQDAELVGIGRCCAAIVRDLRASGHDEAAQVFEQQVEASRWTIREVERKWDDVRAYNAAAENALRRIATACGFVRTHDHPMQIVADVEERLAELEQMRVAVAHASKDIAELQEALREHLDAQAGGMQDRIAGNLFGDDGRPRTLGEELEASVASLCPACHALDMHREPRCPYCNGEGSRAAYDRQHGAAPR